MIRLFNVVNLSLFCDFVGIFLTVMSVIIISVVERVFVVVKMKLCKMISVKDRRRALVNSCS